MTTGNWVENYGYTDTSLILFCDVYYDDTIMDYRTKTISIFKDNRIIQSDHDYLPPHTSYPYRYIYEYNKQGLLISIKMYRTFNSERAYEMVGKITFSFKGIKSIRREVSYLINKTLYNFNSE
jgi:hypothetical protein